MLSVVVLALVQDRFGIALCSLFHLLSQWLVALPLVPALCLIVTSPFAVYQDSGEGYITRRYRCSRDRHKGQARVFRRAVNNDESDIAAQVFGVAYLALSHKHFDWVGWHNRFHLGFLASRVDIS